MCDPIEKEKIRSDKIWAILPNANVFAGTMLSPICKCVKCWFNNDLFARFAAKERGSNDIKWSDLANKRQNTK